MQRSGGQTQYSASANRKWYLLDREAINDQRYRKDGGTPNNERIPIVPPSIIDRPHVWGPQTMSFRFVVHLLLFNSLCRNNKKPYIA